MKLYLIRFDSQDCPVEATTMSRAIATWQAWARDEEGWDGMEEPEQVTEVCDGPVLREKTL